MNEKKKEEMQPTRPQLDAASMIDWIDLEVEKTVHEMNLLDAAYLNRQQRKRVLKKTKEELLTWIKESSMNEQKIKEINDLLEKL